MNSPQLIQPEKLLSLLFYSPNATAVYQGEDINIVSANEAMIKFWGKDKSVIGKTMLDAIPELEDQPFIDMLKKVWNSGETFTAKNYPAFLNKEGILEKFYFAFEYKAILNDADETE